MIESFGQIDEPRYILASKLFDSYKSMAFVVRYDQGIDSITIPIDANKIKINIKKLDINGQELLPKKVYYEYQFTPKVNDFYKIPKGIIWSGKNKFDIVFNDAIKLKIPEPIIKLAVSDSIALNLENQEILLQEQKYYENERQESKVESRIIENLNQKIVVKLWTDHENYIVNDKIRIIVESNKDFNREKIKIEFEKESGNKLELVRTRHGNYYEDGIEKHNIIFIYKSLESGKIIIKPVKLIIDKKEMKTKRLEFEILD